MDLRQIKNLMKEFEESKIHKLEITDKEFSIKLEKENNMAFSYTPSIPSQGLVAAPAAASPVVKEEVVTEAENNILVKSPLVGTYYESPSPDALPFVKVNQKVNKGDTLFIVEAMKVMNEVTSPATGTIVKMNLSDATMVEFNQVVMEIKE